jgi:hypothetical protein
MIQTDLFANANAELGPTGSLVFAGFLALVACGTLVSGLHPRGRGTAKWRGDLCRSAFGSIAFSAGLLTMGVAMMVRTTLQQHGTLTGIVLWLFCGGAALVVLGPGYDLVRSVRRR